MSVTDNVQPCNGTPVTLPDNTQIIPAQQCTIPLGPAFSTTAKTATNLPHLKISSLVAVGPLCDDNKLVIFDKQQVNAVEPNPTLTKAINNSTSVMHGDRNIEDGCWDIILKKEASSHPTIE